MVTAKNCRLVISNISNSASYHSPTPINASSLRPVGDTYHFSSDTPSLSSSVDNEEPSSSINMDSSRDGDSDSLNVTDFPDANCSVFIENVPKDMADFLEIAIESKTDGTMTGFDVDEQLGGVLVTFLEPEGIRVDFS